MATNAKVTAEDVKKAAAEAAKTVEKVAVEAKKELPKVAAEAKKTATKKATEAKKSATKAATKAVSMAKKEVIKTAVVQYQDLEFSMDDIIARATDAFKNDYKKKALEEINVYVKPEERKVYYVANKDCVGSFDL